MSAGELAFTTTMIFATGALILYDLRFGILPDCLNAVLGLAAVCYHWSNGWTEVSSLEALLGGAVGATLLYALRSAYLCFRHTEAVGLGDVKFMAAAGLWIGVWALPQLLIVASLGTLLTVLVLHALPLRAKLAAGVPAGRMGLRFQRVPFGPGLCVALVIVVLERALGT